MTYLISGSILLILASAGTLAWGWIGRNEQMIWASIVLSAGAAVCLALAYYRSKSEATRPAPAGRSPALGVEPAGEPAAESGAGPVEQEQEVSRGSAASETEELSALDAAGDAAPVAGAGPPTGPAAPATGRTSSKPARQPASAAEEVVAIPDRKKFHRPDCRYAKAAGAETMTKAQARRRSFSACGICKP